MHPELFDKAKRCTRSGSFSVFSELNATLALTIETLGIPIQNTPLLECWQLPYCCTTSSFWRVMAHLSLGFSFPS